MNLTRVFRTAAAVLFLSLGLSAPLWAQTALSVTTLTAAMTDTSSRLIQVASATGFTAPGTGSTLVYAIVDREVLGIRTVNGLVVGVTRGARSTRTSTHANGATITVGPPGAFVSYPLSGQCTRTTVPYVPMIEDGTAGLGNEVGQMFDCLGVTTAGQWVLTNGNGPPVLGSTVASPAGVLTPTGTYFKVSGTNAITGILNPAGIAPGFTLYLESTGIWTWTSAGNILTAGTTTAAGRVLILVWNGSKWAPSYVA